MNKWIPAVTAILLAGCSALAPTPTPTATATYTPAASPTPTLTPTVTPDPNMPKGATGQDANGRYFKVEDGKTYYYLPELFGDQEFESGMKRGPIDLTGYGESIWSPISIDLNVYFARDFEYADDCRYLVRPPGPSDYVTKQVPWGSAASQIGYQFFYASTGLNNKTVRQEYKTSEPVERQRLIDDINSVMQALANGKTIDVGGGAWEPRKGYDVYWINEAEAKADPSIYYANDVYSKVKIVDGKLVAAMAAKSRNVFKDNMFFHVLLAPFQAAMYGVSEDIWWMEYQDIGARIPAGSIFRTDPPITITTETIDLVP